MLTNGQRCFRERINDTCDDDQSDTKDDETTDVSDDCIGRRGGRKLGRSEEMWRKSFQ